LEQKAASGKSTRALPVTSSPDLMQVRVDFMA
jgi:hypothetical protein